MRQIGQLPYDRPFSPLLGLLLLYLIADIELDYLLMCDVYKVSRGVSPRVRRPPVIPSHQTCAFSLDLVSV